MFSKIRVYVWFYFSTKFQINEIMKISRFLHDHWQVFSGRKHKHIKDYKLVDETGKSTSSFC